MIAISPILRIAGKAASVVLFLLTIAAAYGGHVPPHVWATPSILTLVLPYLAIASIIVTALWLVGGRWIIGAAGVLTIIVCGGPVLQTVPLGHERALAADDGPEFKLITYNILHGEDLTHNPSTNEAFRYLLHSGADIIALQELLSFTPQEVTKLPEALRDSLFAAYPYRLYDNVRDFTLLSRYPARYGSKVPLSMGRAAFQSYEINIKGHRLTLVNVHLASYALDEEEREIVDDIKGVRSAKASFFEFKGTVLEKLKKGQRDRAENAALLRLYINDVKGPLIVCGDFNDVPASWAYRTVMGDDLRDAYTETNFGPTVTFNQHHFYFHLDQILYRGGLKALDVERMGIRASDHYPLEATFAFTR